MDVRLIASCLAVASFVVTGCSNDADGTTETPDASAEASVSASPVVVVTDADADVDVDACSSLYAKDFDRTCAADSDCVAVPFGGNLCDPCSTGAECFQCAIASVNQGAAAAYTTALRSAIAAAEAQQTSLDCFSASCPSVSGDGGLEPRCVSGICTGYAEGAAGCE